MKLPEKKFSVTEMIWKLTMKMTMNLLTFLAYFNTDYNKPMLRKQAKYPDDVVPFQFKFLLQQLGAFFLPQVCYSLIPSL